MLFKNFYYQHAAIFELIFILLLSEKYKNFLNYSIQNRLLFEVYFKLSVFLSKILLNVNIRKFNSNKHVSINDFFFLSRFIWTKWKSIILYVIDYLKKKKKNV